MSSSNAPLNVETIESARKSINIVNPDNIQGIRVVREKSPPVTDSDSDISSVSDESIEVSRSSKKHSKKHKNSSKFVNDYYEPKHSGRHNERYPAMPLPPAKKLNRHSSKHPHQNYDDFANFSNPKKRGPENMYEDESVSSDDSDRYSDSGSSAASSADSEDWVKKEEEKRDLLIKIQSLEKKGFQFSKKYTMKSDLEEMRFEVEKIKHEVEIQGSIRFQRRVLMACVTGSG